MSFRGREKRRLRQFSFYKLTRRTCILLLVPSLVWTMIIFWQIMKQHPTIFFPTMKNKCHNLILSSLDIIHMFILLLCHQYMSYDIINVISTTRIASFHGNDSHDPTASKWNYTIYRLLVGGFGFSGNNTGIHNNISSWNLMTSLQVPQGAQHDTDNTYCHMNMIASTSAFGVVGASTSHVAAQSGVSLPLQ